MDKITDIVSKIVRGKLAKEDLGDYFEALVQYCSHSGYAEDETYGWDKELQFILNDDEDFYLKVENPFSDHPKLTVIPGYAKNPHSTIISDSATFTGIICGRIRYSEINPGSYKVDGVYSSYTLFITLTRMMVKENS